MVADVSRAAEIITTAEICSERLWNFNYYPSLCLQWDPFRLQRCSWQVKKGIWHASLAFGGDWCFRGFHCESI